MLNYPNPNYWYIQFCGMLLQSFMKTLGHEHVEYCIIRSCSVWCMLYFLIWMLLQTSCSEGLGNQSSTVWEVYVCMYVCMYVHKLAINIIMYRHTHTYICIYVHVSTYTHAIHTWYIRTHTKLSYSSSVFWHLYNISSTSCLTLLSSLSNWILLCYRIHPVNNINKLIF